MDNRYFDSEQMTAGGANGILLALPQAFGSGKLMKLYIIKKYLHNFVEPALSKYP